MTRRVIRGTFVLLLVLAQILMGGMGRFGVLCYGADGHIAVEPNSALCCAGLQGGQSPPAPLPTTVAQASPSAGNHCGPCLDVTFQSTTSPQPRQLPCGAVALAPTTLFLSTGLPGRIVYISSTDCRVESLQFAQTVLRI